MDFICCDFSFILPVVILVITCVFFSIRRPANVPPGPPLLPIVGNLFSLGTQPLAALRTLRGKYGDVFGLYLGSDLNVFVNGYSAVHEVLVKKGSVFSLRPDTLYLRIALKTAALVFANGEKWKANRRLSLTALHDLCFTNRNIHIQERISNELVFLSEKIESYTEPIDLKRDINVSLLNIMCSMIFGKRLQYDDKGLIWYIDHLESTFKLFALRKLITDCFPWLHNLHFDVLRLKSTEKSNVAQLKEFFDSLYKDHLKRCKDGSEECVAKWYTEAMEDSDVYNDENRWALFHDLMAAGSETTATTIQWVILHLVRRPELQTKLQVEIGKVITGDRHPMLSDRSKMPLMEAAILEGLRIGQPVPFAIPHSSKKDTTINGQFIPENTTIMINLSSVLKDPDVFTDPEEFKPERFLDESEKELKVFKEFIPFSLGPRSCLGESLARINLFMYLSTLLQRFEFRIPDDEEAPSTKGAVGLTYSPCPFKVVIKRRK